MIRVARGLSFIPIGQRKTIERKTRGTVVAQGLRISEGLSRKGLEAFAVYQVWMAMYLHPALRTRHLGTRHLRTRHLGTRHLGTRHLGTRHPDVCRHLAETIESTEFLFIVSTGIDQPRIALMWVGQSKRCFGKPLNGLFCGLHV
jgi:hypothetical protein